MEGSSICCVFTDIYVYMEQVTAMVKKYLMIVFIPNFFIQYGVLQHHCRRAYFAQYFRQIILNVPSPIPAKSRELLSRFRETE